MKIKQLQIPITSEEYNVLKKLKGNQSWRSWLLGIIEKNK